MLTLQKDRPVMRVKNTYFGWKFFLAWRRLRRILLRGKLRFELL
jgi:hypothetical protein